MRSSGGGGAPFRRAVDVCFFFLGAGGHDLVSPGKAPVVKHLAEQHHVGDGVVDGEDEHGGQDALEDGAEDVKDVAEEPDDDELEREAVGGGALEVLDDLGGEDYDPTGDGDGAGGLGRGVS